MPTLKPNTYFDDVSIREWKLGFATHLKIYFLAISSSAFQFQISRPGTRISLLFKLLRNQTTSNKNGKILYESIDVLFS
jgi:hypothetical protein